MMKEAEKQEAEGEKRGLIARKPTRVQGVEGFSEEAKGMLFGHKGRFALVGALSTPKPREGGAL